MKNTYKNPQRHTDHYHIKKIFIPYVLYDRKSFLQHPINTLSLFHTGATMPNVEKSLTEIFLCLIFRVGSEAVIRKRIGRIPQDVMPWIVS